MNHIIKNRCNIKVEAPGGYRSFDGLLCKGERETFELQLETTSLECTDGHRVATVNGFEEVKDIKVGDFIILKNDKLETVKSIKPIGMRKVYDLLNVETTNSYYTNNILSHNCEFIESGDTFIDEEYFTKLESEIKDPLHIFDDGAYRVWEDPQPENIYTIGVDVAEGVKKNSSVIQIFDITDLTEIKQVAEYASNEINPYEFSTKVNEICHHWGTSPVLVERNNCGAQVVDTLYQTYRYPNIVSYSPRTGKTKFDRLGVYAHTNTKYKGVTNMRYWVHELKCLTFRSKETIEELRTFQRNANGTWSARSGCDDDRVMSMIWALMILDNALVGKYYDVIEVDDNNKPKRLQLSDFVHQNFSGFLNEYSTNAADNWEPPGVVFQDLNIFDNNPTELDDLVSQGWEVLQ